MQHREQRLQFCDVKASPHGLPNEIGKVLGNRPELGAGGRRVSTNYLLWTMCQEKTMTQPSVDCAAAWNARA